MPESMTQLDDPAVMRGPEFEVGVVRSLLAWMQSTALIPDMNDEAVQNPN